METTKGFVIECRTGCTCCASQNHYRGPFRTREIAERFKQNYWDTKLLASQYAKNGVYDISEVEIETLPDGRIIVDGTHVFKGFAEDTGEEEMDGY